MEIEIYQKIVESAEEGVWLIDGGHKTVFVNEKVCEMTGYTSEEILGHDISMFMDPEESNLLLERLENRKSGVREQHDVIFRKKDGSRLWTTAACSPVFDNQSRYVGALGLVSDVSHRYRNDVLLKTQKEVFEIMLSGGQLKEAVKPMIKALELLIEGAKPVFQFSDAIEKTDSISIISSRGKRLGTLDLNLELGRTLNNDEHDIIQTLTSGAALAIEHIRTCEERDSLLTREKRRREEATIVSNARKMLSSSIEFETVLKQLPKVMIPQLADWCFVALNDHNHELKTVALAAVPEKSGVINGLENFEPDMDAPEGLPRAIREGEAILYSEVDEHMLEIGANGWPMIGTKNTAILEVMKKLGLKSYMAVPIMIRSVAVGGILVVSSRTDRRYNKNDLEVAKEIAQSCSFAIENATLYRRAQDAIRIREEFISIASHELRTPLTSLKTRVDLMNLMFERAKLPEELSHKIRPVIEGIKPDVQKFSKLIETLLDVSKMEGNKFFLHKEEVILTDVIQEEAKRIEADYIRKHTELKTFIQSGMRGHCDYLRLQQVVANLLTNALKFGNHRPVELHAFMEAENLVLKVIDQGIGISKEDQERIFEPFERAVSDVHFGGLGLGLFITHQIVESHGGKIHVTSELEKGTTFIVTIPIR